MRTRVEHQVSGQVPMFLGRKSDNTQVLFGIGESVKASTK